jgi:hypothetical protein
MAYCADCFIAVAAVLLQVSEWPGAHNSSSDFPDLWTFFQKMAADDDARRILEQLCVLLHGRNGAMSLLPCVLMWRTLVVVHAGPAPGEGAQAASSSQHAGPLNAQDLVHKELYEHLWADPADSVEVSRQWVPGKGQGVAA